jgi:hypothetical protein
MIPTTLAITTTIVAYLVGVLTTHQRTRSARATATFQHNAATLRLRAQTHPRTDARVRARLLLPFDPNRYLDT